jgi:hypothetical protein
MTEPELTLEEMQRLIRRGEGGFELALATFPDADVRILFEVYCRHEGIAPGPEKEDDFAWLMGRIAAIRRARH